VGPDTEKEQEPTDSFTDGTASLTIANELKRQFDLFCVTGVTLLVFRMYK